MTSLARKFASACALAVLLTGLGAGSASAEEPEEGCIGIPSLGGLYYHCLSVDVLPLLPRVDPNGSTPAFVRVPPVCLFVTCTQPGVVGTTVPLAVDTTRPSEDVTVFELRNNCFAEYGCYDDGGRHDYYRIAYYAATGTCRFESNVVSPINNSVPCTL